jgi:hypothetical protein
MVMKEGSTQIERLPKLSLMLHVIKTYKKFNDQYSSNFRFYAVNYGLIAARNVSMYLTFKNARVSHKIEMIDGVSVHDTDYGSIVEVKPYTSFNGPLIVNPAPMTVPDDLEIIKQRLIADLDVDFSINQQVIEILYQISCEYPPMIVGKFLASPAYIISDEFSQKDINSIERRELF